MREAAEQEPAGASRELYFSHLQGLAWGPDKLLEDQQLLSLPHSYLKTYWALAISCVKSYTLGSLSQVRRYGRTGTEEDNGGVGPTRTKNNDTNVWRHQEETHYFVFWSKKLINNESAQKNYI